MLPSAHRLRKSDDFKLTIRKGVRTGRSDIVVHMTRGAGDEPARAGLVVSKSVGNAVVRNQVKRRLRAVLRTLVAELPAGVLVVVRALPSSAGASHSSLQDQVSSAMAQCSKRLERSGAASHAGQQR